MDSWPVIRWKHWPTCVESAHGALAYHMRDRNIGRSSNGFVWANALVLEHHFYWHSFVASYYTRYLCDWLCACGKVALANAGCG